MRKADRLNRFFGLLLGAIVVLAAVVLLYGMAVYLWGHGSEVPDYHIFHGVPNRVSPLDCLIEMVCREAAIQAGLFLLMVAPFLRVLFFIFYYLIESNFIYAAFSAFTFIVLIYSLCWVC